MSDFARSRVIKSSFRERMAIALSTAALASMTGLIVLIGLGLSATHRSKGSAQVEGNVTAMAVESQSEGTAEGQADPWLQTEQGVPMETPVTNGTDLFAADPFTSATLAGERNSPERKFLAMLPRLIEADQERVDACNALAQRVQSTLADLDRESIPQSIIDSVTSISSKLQWMQDADAHRAWVAREFEEKVLSASDLINIIQPLIEEYQTTLVDIDNRLLIELRADIDLDPTQIAPNPIDFAPIHAAIHGFQSSIETELVGSIEENLASFFASYVAEEVGRNSARSMLADENGELNALQELTSVLTGLATGFVADAVVSEIMDIDGQITAKCQSVRNTLLRQVTPGYDDGKLWFQEACNLLGRHRDGVLSAIIVELGVDAAWAVEQYNAKVDQLGKGN